MLARKLTTLLTKGDTKVEYVLYKIKKTNKGSRHFYRLHWIDEQGGEYEMTVDPQFRNYTKWSEIVELNVLGVFKNMRQDERFTKYSKTPVLSADNGVLVEQLTQEQAEELYKHLQPKVKHTSNTTFNSLFG